jgi:hypothetical protein
MSERESSASCMMCRIDKNKGTLAHRLPYRIPSSGILAYVDIAQGECVNCAINRHRGFFERVEEAARLGILDTKNGGWRVEWDLFDDAAVNPDKYEPDFYQRLIGLLIDLRILTEDLQSGAYAIMWDSPGQGTAFVAPYRYGGYKSPYTHPLFFIRLEDAKEYAVKFLAGCPWSIVEFGKVTKKEGVAK